MTGYNYCEDESKVIFGLRLVVLTSVSLNININQLTSVSSIVCQTHRLYIRY